MQTVINPDRSLWDDLLRRPTLATADLSDVVRGVIDRVRRDGDRAVKELEQQFDHVTLDTLRVSTEEIDEACRALPADLRQAIDLAARNITTFHAAQRTEPQPVTTSPGVTCWQRALPIERVGLYIPGGTAPLFSTVLMLGLPARIAGCALTVLCTPPGRDGRVHPAVLYAARVAGITHIFKAGGIQAIAAMAYGTETIPRVYKIFGPGNQYVTAAKQMVSLRDVAIDMPAGPSEVEVLADATANPTFVAADLLSQAEHGVDSQALLITTSTALAAAVETEVSRQLSLLPRRDIAARALDHSLIIVVPDTDVAMELTNRYAPEHLIIETADSLSLSERVRHAGSVFIGHYSTESAGDYASGTNHTLPTNGYAKAYSGVCLSSFMHTVTYQHVEPHGLQAIGPAIETMATHEGLQAHRNAVSLRLSTLHTPTDH